MSGEFLQIGREGVVTAGFIGKEKLRHDTHVRLNGDHATGDFLRDLGFGKGGAHGFEPGERERGTSGLEEGAAGERALGAYVHGGGSLLNGYGVGRPMRTFFRASMSASRVVRED